jgi:hypothetical protein
MFSRMMLAATALLAMAAAALAADPTPAPRAVVVAPPIGPQPAGDLSIGVGPLWSPDDPAADNLNQWLLESVTRASMPFLNGWNVEGQANGRAILRSGGPGSIGAPFQASGYAHFWLGSPSSPSAWGGFVGVSTGLAAGGVIYTSLGVEGRTYLPRASLGGAVAGTVMSVGTVNAAAWTFNAAVNFFPNPDNRIGLQGAVIIDIHKGIPTAARDNYYEATLDFEHRLTARPVSLWLAGSATNSAGGFDAWSLTGGFKLYFNQSPRFTLQSHDREVPFTFVLPSVAG